MKISTNTPKNPLSGAGATARADQTGAAATQAGKAEGKPTVDISSAAQQLSNLHNGENDINIERVNEIRAALEAGELKIDTSRIADGLIASARELLK